MKSAFNYQRHSTLLLSEYFRISSGLHVKERAPNACFLHNWLMGRRWPFSVIIPMVYHRCPADPEDSANLYISLLSGVSFLVIKFIFVSVFSPALSVSISRLFILEAGSYSVVQAILKLWPSCPEFPSPEIIGLHIWCSFLF